MVTIDLNNRQPLDEILQTVEGGEVVRLVRGESLVALITPAAMVNKALWDSCNWDDAAWLEGAVKASAQALAEAFPGDDFSDWDVNDAPR